MLPLPWVPADASHKHSNGLQSVRLVGGAVTLTSLTRRGTTIYYGEGFPDEQQVVGVGGVGGRHGDLISMMLLMNVLMVVVVVVDCWCCCLC